MGSFWDLEHGLKGMREGVTKGEIETIRVGLDTLERGIKELREETKLKEQQLSWYLEKSKDDKSVMREMLESKRAQFIVSFIVNVGMVVILAGLYLAEKMR